MKKYIRLLALMLALCAFLCACSSEDEAKNSATATAPIGSDSSGERGSHGEMIFEGTNKVRLYEDDYCSVTLQKAETDSLGDYFWNVALVNKSSAELDFTVDAVYVNDFYFDPVWAASVTAGATVESHITWDAPGLDLRGITQVSRVDFSLRVFDEGGNELVNTDITDYTTSKGAHIEQDRKPQTTDVVLLENSDASVTITGYDDEHRWGCVMDLYLKNTTDKTIVFSVENVLVGGYDCDPQWSFTLPAGKHAMSQMMWVNEQIEEIGDITGFMFDLVLTDESGNEIFRESRTYVP